MHILNGVQKGVLNSVRLDEDSIELAGKTTSIVIYEREAARHFKQNSSVEHLVGEWISPILSHKNCIVKRQIWTSVNGHVFKKMSDCNWIHYKNNTLLHWFDKANVDRQITEERIVHLINTVKDLHFKIFDTKVSTFDKETHQLIEYKGEWNHSPASIKFYFATETQWLLLI